MKLRIYIDGDQGTTGLQILARLRKRNDLDLHCLARAGRKDRVLRETAIRQADIAILCLPDEAARNAVQMAAGSKVRIIDASSAHRTSADWVYGLAELAADQPARIAAAQRVSNPGCYPTGAIMLLRPLIAAGLLAPDYPLSIHAISGYSGGGRERIARYETADAASSDKPSGLPAPGCQLYGLALEHKHVPEIQHHAGLSRRPAFVPAYGNYRQGIVLTIALHRDLLPAEASLTVLHDCLHAYYGSVQAVELPAPDIVGRLEHLDPQALNDTDRIRLHVLGSQASGQVLLAAVFDNLGKGAAGAAVQNLDLMLAAG